MSTTRRLTTAQAFVEFLTQQYTSRDDVELPFFGGVFAIFGHGNVAGLGPALLEARDRLRCVLPRNEQAMVHTAVGYARQKDRLQTWACTASVGPGSTNMLTGAALATINRGDPQLEVLALLTEELPHAQLFDDCCAVFRMHNRVAFAEHKTP